MSEPMAEVHFTAWLRELVPDGPLLWVSENGGERWRLVNAHLPPIYSVRFA